MSSVNTAVSAPTYDKVLVAWLSLAQLITWGGVFYAFSVLLQPLEQELGLTRAQTSLAFSLGLLAEGLLAYPVGRWIDRGHERVVMTGGSILLALGMGLHALVQSQAGFYGVWMLLGAALSATLYNPAFAVVTRRFPQDFRRAIITLTFLGGLASTIFIPLCDWLVRAYGWRWAVGVLGLAQLLVCAPIHWTVLRHAPRQPASRLAAAEAASAAPASLPEPLGPLLRHPAFLWIGLFVVLMMGVTTAIPAHMVSLLREAGLGSAWAVVIPASIGLVQVAGRMLLYFFERRFDVHLANRVIPCLIPLGLLGLIAGLHAGAHALVAGISVGLFVLLYGMGNGMMTIVKGTAMAQYVSRTHVAALNGALGLPSALARAAAPLLLGLWWSEAWGYALGLWALLAASVAAVIGLWMAQRRAILR
ncbi:MFS transporter [Variovorax sp. HJSM1_2]|uniref:MFS transporter n=1 Tax=Variovorax sp. HJSM1_2 TaxID=3366263 RepID=UPI003BC7A880